jgi:hypothetical protein
MPGQFKEQDWYWSVATTAGMVYGSRRNIYVDPATDVDYGNWVTSIGESPYAAADESEIWDFTFRFMPAWLWNGTTMSQPAENQYYKYQLDNYNALTRFNHVNSGMIAAGVPVKTDDYSRNLIQGGYTLALADPTFTTKWFGSDGNFYDLDAAQMIEMGKTVGDHTNTCYTVFSDTANKILTNVITLPSEIDSAYVGL